MISIFSRKLLIGKNCKSTYSFCLFFLEECLSFKNHGEKKNAPYKSENNRWEFGDNRTPSLEALKNSIHGKVITAEDQDYEQARMVWNSMIDRHPALIIQCYGTADVIRAVRFAKEYALLLSVRGAGHNIAGRSLEDHVVLIDLSKLRYVHVDPDKNTATVAPGATLADVDQETQIYELALPVGINSTTGIAGLTLGGGFGWLSRKLGMTIDNLISAEMITVDGKRIVCSKDQHADLFWAIRGGGGNFGIVTSFKFKLHPVASTLFSGPVVFDIKDAKEVFLRYREFCEKAPDEMTVWAVVRNCPPFPFVDASYRNKPVLLLVGIYNGPLAEGQKQLAKVKELGKAIGDGLAPIRLQRFKKPSTLSYHPRPAITGKPKITKNWTNS